MNRKELLRWMPQNAHDVVGAQRVVELGWPTVEPVMRDILRWLRVATSPVAETFAAFLADLGEPAVEAVAWHGLHPENCWARRRILCDVLPHWPTQALERIAFMLTTTATQPDPYDNDLRAVELLARHRLADPAWLRGWLEFKAERLAARQGLFERAARAVHDATSGGA